jgi:hypothetical protein
VLELKQNPPISLPISDNSQNPNSSVFIPVLSTSQQGNTAIMKIIGCFVKKMLEILDVHQRKSLRKDAKKDVKCVKCKPFKILIPRIRIDGISFRYR